MKNSLGLLLVLVTLHSCLNMTDPVNQAEYIENLKSFDKALVSHFPKKIPGNWIASSFGPLEYINDKNIPTAISLTIQISSKEKYEDVKDQLEKEAKVIVTPADSCLIIVDSKENQTLKSGNCCYPVPLHTVYESEDEKSKRSENCEIALLDFQAGNILKDNGLPPKESLPGIWKNGFSKGYSFNNNKQTIRYWLIIW